MEADIIGVEVRLCTSPVVHACHNLVEAVRAYRDEPKHTGEGYAYTNTLEFKEIQAERDRLAGDKMRAEHVVIQAILKAYGVSVARKGRKGGDDGEHDAATGRG